MPPNSQAVDPARIAALRRLEEDLRHRFRRLDLLDQALTHTSYAHERGSLRAHHNERLEFLGDAVVGLIVADLIYRRFPDAPEGRMARARANLVRESALAKIGRQLQLGDLLRLGRGERRSGGRERDSLLADAVEAVIAAVYLDAGYAKTYPIVERLWEPYIEELGAAGEINAARDPKSALQELLQAETQSAPIYRLREAIGPDHAKIFVSEVLHQGRVLAVGTGRSKREAEQAAAREALKSY